MLVLFVVPNCIDL